MKKFVLVIKYEDRDKESLEIEFQQLVDIFTAIEPKSSFFYQAQDCLADFTRVKLLAEQIISLDELVNKPQGERVVKLDNGHLKVRVFLLIE